MHRKYKIERKKKEREKKGRKDRIRKEKEGVKILNIKNTEHWQWRNLRVYVCFVCIVSRV